MQADHQSAVIVGLNSYLLVMIGSFFIRANVDWLQNCRQQATEPSTDAVSADSIARCLRISPNSLSPQTGGGRRA